MTAGVSQLVQLFLLAAVAGRGSSRVCTGLDLSSAAFDKHRNVSQLEADFAKAVSGCHYVNGDLRIDHLGIEHVTDKPIDALRSLRTDFLNSIVEINGRLVLKWVNLERLTLRNLRVVRGNNPANRDAFFAIDFHQLRYPMRLEMPQLSAVQQGDVKMIGNMHASIYCPLARHVQWSSLFQEKSQVFIDSITNVTLGDRHIAASNSFEIGRACESLPKCHNSCHAEQSGRQLCWSDGPDGCQRFHGCSEITQPGCRSCFREPSDGAEKCCSDFCLGGCANQQDSCFVCPNVNHNGSCLGRCPLNADLKGLKAGSAKLKQLVSICVNDCEKPFVTSSDGAFCFAECPSGERPIGGVCTPCNGAGQTSCLDYSIEEPELSDTLAATLKMSNASIWRASSEHLDVNAVKLSKRESLQALEGLQFFYGDLSIKRTQKHSQSIDFLRNLKFVSGNFAAMLLEAKYIGLVSLLHTGGIFMLMNISGLCPAWYPHNRIKEIKAKVLFLQFDNQSEVCRAAACDPQCRDECWGPGADMCVACRGVRLEGRCLASCRQAGRYELDGRCRPCHAECRGGCSGPSNSECDSCKHVAEGRHCVAACSGEEARVSLNGVCYSVIQLALGATLISLTLPLCVLLPLVYLNYRRRLLRYELVDLDEHIADRNGMTNTASELLIVNYEDVIKHSTVHECDFGVAYQGVLRTNTRRGVRKLRAAIMVLRESQAKRGQELLNEASSLARVYHPFCARLVALCPTQEPQLITTLMPRGRLLDFLRTRRNRIGAERMLRWSLQVAEGMEYLDSLGIVHRDLAARNVQLQSIDHARIADFGLASLLDISDGEFVQLASLNRLQWLALEALELGQFSHKSDVWSYGVLLWEICTFGESPYDPYGIRSAKDLAELLRKGVRLSQPDCCSVDFFNILLNCWLPQQASRPSFTELVGIISDCLASPGKFIAQLYQRDDRLNLIEPTDLAADADSGLAPPLPPSQLLTPPVKNVGQSSADGSLELDGYIQPTSSGNDGVLG